MPVPDYLGGVIARVKQHAPTMALVNGQVSASKGDKWVAKTYAVLINRAGAMPIDVLGGTLRMDALVDLFAYGPTEYEAVQGLWAPLHDWICPDGLSLPNCYRPGPAGLLFDTVTHYGGPTYLVEQQTGWGYAAVRYAFRFSTVGA